MSRHAQMQMKCQLLLPPLVTEGLSSELSGRESALLAGEYAAHQIRLPLLATVSLDLA